MIVLRFFWGRRVVSEENLHMFDDIFDDLGNLLWWKRGE